MAKKLFRVQQNRVRTVVYEREIWAENEQAAIAEGEVGTAWPETYDEATKSLEKLPMTAEEIEPNVHQLRDFAINEGTDIDEDPPT